MRYSCFALLLFVYAGSFAQKTDFLAANIDKSVKAPVDFFEYANGGWIAKTPIPSSESGWGIGNLVQEEIYNRILSINKNAAKDR
jgi:putative endopeptidase